MVAAARVNMQTIAKVKELVMRYSQRLSPLHLAAARRIIWDCKRYLLYHGWVTYSEAIGSMKRLLASELQRAEDDMSISDHDNYKILLVNEEFERWRRNGSEFAFWQTWQRLRVEAQQLVGAGRSSDACLAYLDCKKRGTG